MTIQPCTSTLVLSDVIPTIIHRHSGRAAGGDENEVLAVGRWEKEGGKKKGRRCAT